MPVEIPITDLQYSMAKQSITSSKRAFDGNFWREAIRETEPKIELNPKIIATEAATGAKRWVAHAASRISPEGVVASGVISTASWFYNTPVGVPISDAIHNLGWNTEASVAKVAAVAILGGVGAASVALEAKTFEKKKYSSSPPGTILYEGTGRARLSSALVHIADHAWLSLLNPYVGAGIVHNDTRSIIDGFLAVSSTLLAWNLSWNMLILKGKADPFVNKIKPYTDRLISGKNSLLRRIRRNEKSKMKEDI